MSNNLKEKLIDLFADHSVKEIEKGSGALLKKTFGTNKYNEFVTDENFGKYYEMLKGLRKNLDEMLTGQTAIEQVKGCLRLLKEIKNDKPEEHMGVLSRLIQKSFYNTWDQKKRDYYDTGNQMLTEWKDFFLSYTNRNKLETNHDCKTQICDALGDTYFEENVEKVNCVARLIFHYLALNNLTAFYDQENMKCGDEINEEIEKHCRAIYAFVQLVEDVSFQAQTNDQNNWCFHEFKIFEEWSSKNLLQQHKRYYFILTKNQEDVFPASFPGYYKDWKDRITGHLHIRKLSSLNKNKIRLECKKIANEIVKSREKVHNDYIE